MNSDKFVLSGGVTQDSDRTWVVTCRFGQIASESIALMISQWLNDLVTGELNRGGVLNLDRLPDTNADTVVNWLRDHLADVHGADCDRRTVPCTCHYEKRAEELIREAAARIEVAIEALQGSTERQPSGLAAYYALTADHHA